MLLLYSVTWHINSEPWHAACGVSVGVYCLTPTTVLCRKKKAVHKVSTTDDKRLQATLKRLGVNTIPGIEEVNLFVDNDVIHFTNPKGVQLFYLCRKCSDVCQQHHAALPQH